MHKFNFSLSSLEQQLRLAVAFDYRFISCEDFVTQKSKGTLHHKTVVNRIDIDFSVKKVEPLLDIFTDLGIKGTFFVRLHAPEYNPFSFENYRIITKLLQGGHELGYHSEVVDQAAIWNEDEENCLTRDLKVLSEMYGVRIRGVASHGGMTGLNNLKFWEAHKPSDFGLLYEAYDKEKEFNLFESSFYISDSQWTHWKCYNRGKLVENDFRSFGDHIKDGHELIYLLIHPDTYFTRHFYE